MFEQFVVMYVIVLCFVLMFSYDVDQELICVVVGVGVSVYFVEGLLVECFVLIFEVVFVCFLYDDVLCCWLVDVECEFEECKLIDCVKCVLMDQCKLFEYDVYVVLCKCVMDQGLCIVDVV